MKAVLKNLVAGATGPSVLKKLCIIHSTGYDGALEEACLSLNIPCMTQEWKAGTGLMKDVAPRYQPEFPGGSLELAS